MIADLWLLDGLSSRFVEAASELALRGGPVPSVANRGPISVSIGTKAIIRIDGALIPDDSSLPFLRMLTTTTSYQSIREALSSAEKDPSVKAVELKIDSPGGTVRGLFHTLAQLEAYTKPITVVATVAASAAYAIAAAAGPIMAVGSDSSFGSIGVATSFLVNPYVVDIASRNAPAKRPNLATDAGKAVVQDYLDEMHALFISAIARGRSTSTAAINDGYGSGRMFLAHSALGRGMIDAVSDYFILGSGESGESMGRRAMAGPRTHTAHVAHGYAGDLGDRVADMVGAPMIAQSEDMSDVLAKMDAQRYTK